MLMTPYRCASSGSSSILTLTTLALPACSSATWSTTGENMRQGPHQGAQKSTRTGTWAESTSRSKVLLLTDKTDIFEVPFP